MLISLNDAKALLRVYDDSDDADIASLTSSIAAYLKNATGHDWNGDNPPDPVAVHCMRAMLVKLYDRRDDVHPGISALDYGITNWISQLQWIEKPTAKPEPEMEVNP